MQIQTKQRILGALAILAILAIILPFIFRTSSFSLANHDKQNKQRNLNMANKQKVLQQPLTVDMTPHQPKAITNQPMVSTPSQQKQVITTHIQPTASTTVQNNQTNDATNLSISQQSPAVTTNKSKSSSGQINSSQSKKANRSGISMTTTAADNSSNNLAKSTAIKSNKEPSKKLSAAATMLPKQHAYALQLGSFSNKKNVDQLLIKLRKMGFTAFYKPVIVDNSQLYRVYVGPELKKTRITTWQKILNRTLKINSKIISYKATS